MAAFLTLLTYLGNPALPVVFGAAGVISWAVWHYLSRRVSHLLVPRQARKAVLVLQRPSEEGRPGVFKLAFLATLFTFSVISLGAEVLDYPVESFEGMVMATVYLIFLLPLAFFVPAKLVIENSGIVMVTEGDVEEVPAYPYIDEFLGFGALLGLVLTLSKFLASYASNVATGLIYALLFFLFQLYPALIASLLYVRLSYHGAAGELRNRLNPLIARVSILITCYRCGARLAGREAACPHCGAPLRGAPPPPARLSGRRRAGP